MFEYVRICRWIGMRLGPQQHRAAQYLELRGKRFCVDFGKDNAIDRWRGRCGVPRNRRNRPGTLRGCADGGDI